jgi:tetratricopeptide (TPR) repeat protein
MSVEITQKPSADNPMATNSTSLHFKLYLNNNQEIRRPVIQSQTITTWSAFVELVTSLFQLNPLEKLNISYLDEENDKVRVDSDIEWEHALSIFSKQTLSKIFIQTKNEPKDNENPDQKKEFQKDRMFRGRCRFGLQNHEQPFSRPMFWKTMCKRQMPFSQENSAETPCLRRFGRGKRLHFAAYHALVQKNYEQARELYLVLLKRNPQDYLALYNLACCEALCNSKDLALSYLYLAVANGYDRYEHMREDEDLTSLRDDPTFQSILESIAKKQTDTDVNVQ